MAILKREELLEAVRTRIGDDDSDEAIQFMEDITDTVNDYEKRSSGYDEMKEKYENNDKEWRRKYKARFYDGDGNVTQTVEEETVETEKVVEEKEKFEDLFEEV